MQNSAFGGCDVGALQRNPSLLPSPGPSLAREATLIAFRETKKSSERPAASPAVPQQTSATLDGPVRNAR